MGTRTGQRCLFIAACLTGDRQHGAIISTTPTSIALRFICRPDRIIIRDTVGRAGLEVRIVNRLVGRLPQQRIVFGGDGSVARSWFVLSRTRNRFHSMALPGGGPAHTARPGAAA